MPTTEDPRTAMERQALDLALENAAMSVKILRELLEVQTRVVNRDYDTVDPDEALKAALAPVDFVARPDNVVDFPDGAA